MERAASDAVSVLRAATTSTRALVAVVVCAFLYRVVWIDPAELAAMRADGQRIDARLSAMEQSFAASASAIREQVGATRDLVQRIDAVLMKWSK